MLAALGAYEGASLMKHPWGMAAYSPEGDAPWNGVAPIRVRSIPKAAVAEPATPWWFAWVPQGEEVATQLGLDKMESIVLLDLPENADDVLASGRVPEPGENEVIAGYLARFDTFSIGDTNFEVVGRLERSVPNFAFAYILPTHDSYDPLFTEETGATKGWMHWQGLDKLMAAENPEELLGDQRIHAGRALSHPAVAIGAIAALGIIACGGVVLWGGAFQWIRRNDIVLLRPILNEFQRRPVTYYTLHVALYAFVLVSMLVAEMFPLGNHRLQELLAATFEEGDLAYIGAAYESGNILRAAGATFIQNFFVATIIMTIIPSFVVPFWGLLKSIVSFLVVGFGLAPIWTGSAQRMTFHSITMVLELEAYIVASFAVVAFPFIVVRGLAGDGPGAAVMQGVKVMLSAALLAGMILTLAALYEAASLILLRG